MSIHEKLREVLTNLYETGWQNGSEQDGPAYGDDPVEKAIKLLFGETEASSDAAESLEALRADVAILSRALAETAGEEPERPEGIPKRTFRSRDPYTDLRGWLAQRITYASFVEGKMPDAKRRYLAKAWGRDLKLALSSLNKADRTPSDAAESVEGDGLFEEVMAAMDDYADGKLTAPQVALRIRRFLSTPTPARVEGETFRERYTAICEGFDGFGGDSDETFHAQVIALLAEADALTAPSPSEPEAGAASHGLPTLRAAELYTTDTPPPQPTGEDGGYGPSDPDLLIDCGPGVQVTALDNGRFLAERTPEPSAPDVGPWLASEVKRVWARVLRTHDAFEAIGFPGGSSWAVHVSGPVLEALLKRAGFEAGAYENDAEFERMLDEEDLELEPPEPSAPNGLARYREAASHLHACAEGQDALADQLRARSITLRDFATELSGLPTPTPARLPDGESE